MWFKVQKPNSEKSRGLCRRLRKGSPVSKEVDEKDFFRFYWRLVSLVYTAISRGTIETFIVHIRSDCKGEDWARPTFERREGAHKCERPAEATRSFYRTRYLFYNTSRPSDVIDALSSYVQTVWKERRWCRELRCKPVLLWAFQFGLRLCDVIFVSVSDY